MSQCNSHFLLGLQSLQPLKIFRIKEKAVFSFLLFMWWIEFCLLDWVIFNWLKVGFA